MTMCLRRIPAPLCRNAASVRCAVSTRGAAVCWLEPASWRHRHTPVSEGARLKLSPVSGSWQIRLKGTDSRVSCWTGILQQVKATPWDARGTVPPVYPGGHARSVASFRSVVSPPARGLCSGKAEETPGSTGAGDRNEASPVPGQGLFKFKELVSAEQPDCDSYVEECDVRNKTEGNTYTCVTYLCTDRNQQKLSSES